MTMGRKPNLWWVSRRHYQAGQMYIQIKKTPTYKDAVSIARKWYNIHGVGYGIEIKYLIPEIGELVRVRDYYLINSVEDMV